MLKKILLISFIVLTFSRVLVANEKNFENKSDFIHQLTNDESFVWRINPSEKVVALTFDDGPDPRYTPKVLHILSKYNIKATFFVVGENVQLYPDLLKKEFLDGLKLVTTPIHTLISQQFHTKMPWPKSKPMMRLSKNIQAKNRLFSALQRVSRMKQSFQQLRQKSTKRHFGR
jgi:peptidoglycan/xylan/chitin deacetylase (PgdA/CDA1 family)